MDPVSLAQGDFSSCRLGNWIFCIKSPRQRLPTCVQKLGGSLSVAFTFGQDSSSLLSFSTGPSRNRCVKFLSMLKKIRVLKFIEGL